MISSRCVVAIWLGSTIKPPFGSRVKSSMARSTSAAWRTPAGVAFTPEDVQSRDRAQESGQRGMLGERDEEDTARLRRHVLERLQPFSRERQFEMGEAGDISARTRQACHDAKVDWIGHLHKYDRDGRCRLSRLDRRHMPFPHDEVRRFADELGRIGPDVIRIACAPDNVDPDIAVLRPTQLPQALAKRFDAGARIGGALAPMSRPTFRIRSACCARATSGHVAAPPRSVMNARRLMSSMQPLRALPNPAKRSLPHAEAAAEAPAGPWGRPELF